MLGIFVSKFHEFIPVVENKDPHRLHVRLEQTPSESHLQNSTRHTKLFWDWTIFLNNDFGRLTRTEPLFRGIRVAVLTHFTSHVTILINLSSIGLSISWQQISTLCWACWGVNSWGTDLQFLYDFPSVLNWWCMVSFDAQSSSDSLWELKIWNFPGDGY